MKYHHFGTSQEMKKKNGTYMATPRGSFSIMEMRLEGQIGFNKSEDQLGLQVPIIDLNITLGKKLSCEPHSLVEILSKFVQSRFDVVNVQK